MNPQELSEADAQLVLQSLVNQQHFSNPDVLVALADVHATFRKWLHVHDTNRIDVVLAVALSQKMEGTPLWLILVSRSGDMKSEQINALDDDEETTKVIHRFTDKTLVNGFPDKKKFPDLAPLLDKKVVLIPDMAEILQLHPNIKSQVWAQLRDLYDGYAGVQTGMGTDQAYKGLRVTLLAASTPAIDEQILIHQSLGTREFVYRPKEVVDVNKLMERVWFNERFEKQMRGELRAVCRGFLRGRAVRPANIPPDMATQIMALATYLAVMRSSAPTDSYSGELRGMIHPEQPTRILKQLKRLFVCLKNLDDEYQDEKALEIVREVVESSVDVMRQKTLALLLDSGPFTTTKVAEALKVGKKTAKTELYTLWHLGVVKRQAEEITTPYGQTVLVQETWTADIENEVVKVYKSLREASPKNTQADSGNSSQHAEQNISALEDSMSLSNTHRVEMYRDSICHSVTGQEKTDHTARPPIPVFGKNGQWTECPRCGALKYDLVTGKCLLCDREKEGD